MQEVQEQVIQAEQEKEDLLERQRIVLEEPMTL